MSRFFLNIEIKEDTARKLAEAQGKPTKNYLFAREFNAVVSRILTLFSLFQIINEKLYAVASETPIIDLDDISGAGMLFWEWMNINDIQTLNAPVFVTFNDGQKKYVYSFIGLDGTYGAGSDQLSAADFIKLEESFINDVIQVEKVLSFNLSQQESLSPTTTVHKNSTGLTPTFIRNQSGVFTWTFPPGTNLDPSKVELLIGSPLLIIGNYNIKAAITATEMTITTNNGNTPSDNVLNNTSIRMTLFG